MSKATQGFTLFCCVPLLALHEVLTSDVLAWLGLKSVALAFRICGLAQSCQ